MLVFTQFIAFLDKLYTKLKPTIEQKTFEHTRKVLRGKIGVVFYDMTTLYFEASEEDDYRIPGFNKDGKHQHPQVMIGLLVSSGGFPLDTKYLKEILRKQKL